MTQASSQAKRRFFKLPDSLFGQLLCVLVLGVVILQAANFEVVCNVQRLYVVQAEKSSAEHLVTCWFLFDSMTAEQRKEATGRMSSSGTRDARHNTVELLPERPDWDADSGDVSGGTSGDASGEAGRLYSTIQQTFAGCTDIIPPFVVRNPEPASSLLPVHLPVLETAVRLTDGTWLKVTQPYSVDDRYVVWTQRLFVLLEAIVMLVLTAMVLMRITRPIRRLASAAESFGKKPELSEPFPEQGVRELREAAQSFNHMRDRICGNLAERDRMIVAMAHDLRTPLTKLQLRLDRVAPEELRRKMQETVSDIRGIISQGLELARSLNTEEAMARLDMKAFLQSIADDYADTGHNVVLEDLSREESGDIIIEARPLCLKRCVENLISNACKYGDGAMVSLEGGRDHIAICVADNGPGIPEEMLERVFEPYFRLEPSRNRISGGIGLGLAIARNMALLNNGELILANRPQGKGLVARIVLPRQRQPRQGKDGQK
ncbi:MAG: HAMP domain-containing sensor histidine kinase [Desulfovibrionaceae bacterium]|nr:HAMP domain-containing sensor histidine kinase [Desulfovibrionaceae bacterium]